MYVYVVLVVWRFRWATLAIVSNLGPRREEFHTVKSHDCTERSLISEIFQ